MFGQERNFQLLGWKIDKLKISVAKPLAFAGRYRPELKFILWLRCAVFLISNDDISI